MVLVEPRMLLTSWLPGQGNEKAELPAQPESRRGGSAGAQRERAAGIPASEEAKEANPSVVKRKRASLGPGTQALARATCLDQLRWSAQPLGSDSEVAGCSGLQILGGAIP